MIEITSNYQKHTCKNPLQKFLLNNFYQELLKLVKDSKSKSILDAGCGEGFTLAELKLNGILAKMEGVDSEVRAINIGRNIYPDLELRVANVYKLPYKNNSFDLVLCNEVLEHLEEPKKAVKELIRVAKNFVIISVPHEPWFQISNLMRGKYLRTLGNHPEHINHWGPKSIEKLFSGIVFRTIDKKYPYPWILVYLSK